jgi:hypothetical protein
VGKSANGLRDVFPDKPDSSFRPTAPDGDRRGKVGPKLEAALDQLSARMERLKKQAEDLAAAFAPKRK